MGFSFFNEWLMAKVLSHLCAKEGCNAIENKLTAESAKTIVEDAFGFRYEITIKTVGRIATDTREMELYNGQK